MATQSQTLKQIRQSIGINLGDMILITASSTVDTASVIANISLTKGGDDEYNGRYLYMATPAGSIAAGEESVVTDFNGDTHDATVSPVFSDDVTTGDVLEMWHVFNVDEVNNVINQAIDSVSSSVLNDKQSRTAFTEDKKYLYNCLTDFTHVFTVEYVSDTGTEDILHRCDTAWDELVDGDVTATADTSFKQQGSASLKLVVGSSCGAGDILATDDITSLDISDCTEAQIWIYSTVALAAGDIQLLLDNTSNCVSPVETLDIPATTANTWTRHIISLSNPQSDSAIISVGLKMVVDKGAFNLWADDIKAIDDTTNLYKELPTEHWDITGASTKYLSVSQNGLSLTGTNTQLRLTGYQLVSRLTSDSDTSEVNPSYIIAEVMKRLLMSHAKSSYLDIHDRAGRARDWERESQRLLPGLTTSLDARSKEV